MVYNMGLKHLQTIRSNLCAYSTPLVQRQSCMNERSSTGNRISLNREMDRIVPHELYPNGVVPVPECPIKGTAFFPGGSGLYLEDRGLDTAEFPFGGMMVLGHNFDSESGFRNSVERTKEDVTQGTWKGLLRLLRKAGVLLDQCFFTNAFMGLCQGTDNRTYRGRTDQGFRSACLSFLRRQIEFQEPSMIVTLGTFVPAFLAELSRNLDHYKRSSQRDPSLSLKEMDADPITMGASIDLSSGSKHTATVVPIAHPSLPTIGSRK
jgi:hypothetical protein